MKKLLPVLLIVFMSLTLLVSCERILDIITGLFDSGDGDVEYGIDYDYSNGGGAESASDLAGTWKATTQHFDDGFHLADYYLTITMDAAGNITVYEIGEGGDVNADFYGTFELDGDQIKIEKKNLTTNEVRDPWVGIRPLEGGAVGIYETRDKAEFNNPDNDVLYFDYTVDGKMLKKSYFTDFQGITTRDITFDFAPGNYSDLAVNSGFSIRIVSGEAVDYETRIQLETKDRCAAVKVDEVAAAPQGVTVTFRYSETACKWDRHAMWYSYDPQTGEFVIFWRNEPVVLTRQK